MSKNFIFDLDGTLFDSYETIVDSLYQVCNIYNLSFTKNEIHQYVIESSVNAFIKNKIPFDFEEVRLKYRSISEARINEIKLIKNAKETLELLDKSKASLYVYTHRGISTNATLERLEIASYFKDVISACNNFQRKPNPEGINYLISKYNLNKEETYYVGDRNIDMECAKNANIKGILFFPLNSLSIPKGFEDFIIADLKELININEN